MSREIAVSAKIKENLCLLKGQSHVKVCEIMTWDCRMGLNYDLPTVLNF
jgi:hypothetical protein